VYPTTKNLEFYSFNHLFCIFIPYKSVMSLLQLVENQIGTILSWPRLILKYLFCEPASSLTTLAIINSFYGNGVPCEMAVQLFRACNEKATDLLFEELYYYYYDIWQNSKDATHLGIYINFKVKNTCTSTVHIKISSKLLTFLTPINLRVLDLEIYVKITQKENKTNSQACKLQIRNVRLCKYVKIYQ